MASRSADLVLVVDGDERFRASIRQLCERMGCRTAEAASGEEALDALRLELPAVIVTNVRLAGISGYELCREVKDSLGASMPIVFMSEERTEPFDIAGGLLIGADDYIVCPFHPGEFLGRVRRFVHPHNRESTVDRGLTRREQEVLWLLAHGSRQAEIACELSISPTTVATHIQHILAKLGVNSRTQAVALALRSGLVKA